MSKNLDPDIYQKEAVKFDQWLRKVKQTNPEFFEGLKLKIQQLPPHDLKLSFEVFFLEVNETETFHYYVDPVQGPITLFDFVGKIRSWTSGYHGRLLTRMQAFMIQDMIREDVAENPHSYKKPEEYLEYFENTVGAERFFDENEGIITILNEGVQPTGDPLLNFSEEEAIMILKYFSSTGFASYLPQWILFIIDHPYVDASGHENFVPLTRAFDILQTTEFPSHLVRQLFEKRGYLTPPDSDQILPKDKERQGFIYEAAHRCLSKLPKAEARYIPYDDRDSTTLRSPIRLVAKKTKRKSPEKFEILLEKFMSSQATPDHYFEYRALAKRLLKTHRPEAITAIVDEALTFKNVTYPVNAPLRPFFIGLIGYLVSNDKLETSLQDIATNSPSTGTGISGFVNFSAILVRWAERNHIDLNEVFGEAFENYEAPEEIRLLQEEIKKLEEEISIRRDEILVSQSEERKLLEQRELLNDNLHEKITDLESTLSQSKKYLTPSILAHVELFLVKARSADSDHHEPSKQVDPLLQLIEARKIYLVSQMDEENPQSYTTFEAELELLAHLGANISQIQQNYDGFKNNSDSLDDIAFTILPHELALDGHEDEIGLVLLKERKERERNRKIAKLADDPTTFADQAVMQVITYVYNQVRKQYLLETLISGGEVAAELILRHLEDDVLPQQAKLIQNKEHYTEQDYQARMEEIKYRIDFLLSVLSQMEGTEYINDFNLSHKSKDRYRRGNL